MGAATKSQDGGLCAVCVVYLLLVSPVTFTRRSNVMAEKASSQCCLDFGVWQRSEHSSCESRAMVCLPAPPPSLHEPDTPSLGHFGDFNMAAWIWTCPPARPNYTAAQPLSLRNVNRARWSPGFQDQLGSFGLGEALFCSSERRPEVQTAFTDEQHDGVCLMWRLCQLQKVRISNEGSTRRCFCKGGWTPAIWRLLNLRSTQRMKLK